MIAPPQKMLLCPTSTSPTFAMNSLGAALVPPTILDCNFIFI